MDFVWERDNLLSGSSPESSPESGRLDDFFRSGDPDKAQANKDSYDAAAVRAKEADAKYNAVHNSVETDLAATDRKGLFGGGGLESLTQAIGMDYGESEKITSAIADAIGPSLVKGQRWVSDLFKELGVAKDRVDVATGWGSGDGSLIKNPMRAVETEYPDSPKTLEEFLALNPNRHKEYSSPIKELSGIDVRKLGTGQIKPTHKSGDKYEMTNRERDAVKRKLKGLDSIKDSIEDAKEFLGLQLKAPARNAAADQKRAMGGVKPVKELEGVDVKGMLQGKVKPTKRIRDEDYEMTEREQTSANNKLRKELLRTRPKQSIWKVAKQIEDALGLKILAVDKDGKPHKLTDMVGKKKKKKKAKTEKKSK